VDFRVLGPLEVINGGEPLSLGGARQRAVLAYLVLEANRVVPTTRLIDQIWGDEPPDAARQALFAYVSRLRKLLGPGRIQARPPGYVLWAERHEVDALRFTDLVDEAYHASADREAVAARLAEALELWRGATLSDLAGYDALRPAMARLEELRIAALEDRMQAEIDLGRHRGTVPQLEELTREHPLRERLWGQLILALYRSGRQADALAAFHRARRTLLEELGIDPSQPLAQLHQRVLRQDPDLAVPEPMPAATMSGGATASRPPPHLPVATANARTWPLPWYVIGFVPLAALAVAAALWIGQRPTALPPGTWTIGLDMPLSGSGAHLGEPVRNAVQMAVDDINAAGGIYGSTLALQAFDDGGDPARAAANAESFVADPRTIALIGPWGSAPAFETIPHTNEAGLLQCSPSATHPGLTKPRDGALDLRAARADAISFVRLAPADDIQAVAMAAFASHDLNARSVLVIDDTDVGRVIVDPFEREFSKLGGTTVRRALNPGADPRTVLAPLDSSGSLPDLVFFGGETDTGAVTIRRTMAETGHTATPLLSWDFLFDGSGRDPGSYLAQVGMPAAVGTYVAHASLPDPKFSFTDAYRQRFGAAPDEYAPGGYACVEIIAAALRRVAPEGPSAAELREVVRGYVVDPSHRYETVLGSVGFDANGDTLQQFVTFYRVEASAADGAGDWTTFDKQDFGPAP
jgi:DNA-binding SARP family transcriptional activator/ABC-type branched-subunit amino acid transport system substrate-binding protein